MSPTRRSALPYVRSRPASASPASVLSRVLAIIAVLGAVVGISLAGASAALARPAQPTNVVASGGTGLNGEVFISEVFTHGAGLTGAGTTGDDGNLVAGGDWIELHNTSSTDTVNLAGVVISDSDNSHEFVIGTDGELTGPNAVPTTIGPDSYVAIRTDADDNSGKANFSLGDVDEARIWASTDDFAGGSGTPADEFDWGHAPVHSWARNFAAETTPGDPATAPWEASTEETPSAENQFSTTAPTLTGVTVNEVNMNGGPADAAGQPSGDWVELFNTTGSDIDLTGAILSDDDPTHAYIIGADEPHTLPANGFLTIGVDNAGHPGSFGLGDQDSVELYSANITDLFGEADDPASGTVGTPPTSVDSTSWPNAPVYTWGRLDTDGTGTFGPTNGPTENTTNTTPPALPTHHDLTDVVINEVKTTGDADNGDWVELYNSDTQTRDDPIDLSGAILSDDNDSHIIRIADGTTLAAGHTLLIRTDTDGGTVDSHGNLLSANPVASGDFGLGDNDEVRLFAADATDLGAYSFNQHAPGFDNNTAWDWFSWIGHDHAPTSYGRFNNEVDPNSVLKDDDNPNGEWTETSAPTPNNATNTIGGAVTPDQSWIQINEAESSEDFPGEIANDYIELINTASVPIDVTNMVLSDDGGKNHDDAILLTQDDLNGGVPDPTVSGDVDIPANGIAYVAVDDSSVSGNFGLGSNDQARLFLTGANVATSIPIDHFEWTDHAAGSYQRQDNGLGDWLDCTPPTAGSANIEGGPDCVALP